MTRIPETADWITHRWDDLQDLIVKGTPLPWREHNLTPEQRSALDAQARAERHTQGTLGDTPAPIHLTALDLTTEIYTHIQDLLVTIAPPKIGHWAATNHPPIRLLLSYLKDHPATEDEAAAINHTLHRAKAAMAALFSEVTDGQRLKCDCPWCHQPTLTIRLIGPDGAQQPVVRCESGVCEPPSADCGTWHRGLPAWPFHEWDWLSQRINHSTQHPKLA